MLSVRMLEIEGCGKLESKRVCFLTVSLHYGTYNKHMKSWSLLSVSQLFRSAATLWGLWCTYVASKASAHNTAGFQQVKHQQPLLASLGNTGTDSSSDEVDRYVSRVPYYFFFYPVLKRYLIYTHVCDITVWQKSIHPSLSVHLSWLLWK